MRRSNYVRFWVVFFLLILVVDYAYADEKAGAAYERWKSCVALFNQKGARSVADLQVLFEPPGDVKPLLQDIRMVWQQNFLLEPAFYDPAVFGRLFGGDAVIGNIPVHPLTADVGFIVIRLEGQMMRGMTVRAESRCWRQDYKPPGSPMQSTVTMTGHLWLEGKVISQMALRSVRGVFGQETENTVDLGISDDGIEYSVVDKGSVAYADRVAEKAVGGQIRTTFFFKGDSSPQSAESLRSIADGDIVQRIEMNDERSSVMGR